MDEPARRPPSEDWHVDCTSIRRGSRCGGVCAKMQQEGASFPQGQHSAGSFLDHLSTTIKSGNRPDVSAHCYSRSQPTAAPGQSPSGTMKPGQRKHDATDNDNRLPHFLTEPPFLYMLCAIDHAFCRVFHWSVPLPDVVIDVMGDCDVAKPLAARVTARSRIRLVHLPSVAAQDASRSSAPLPAIPSHALLYPFHLLRLCRRRQLRCHR